MSASPPEHSIPPKRDLLSPLRLVVRLRLSPTATIPIGAVFRYAAHRPLTVRADFSVPTGAVVTWHISRDLLLSGMREPSGEGDVRVWPPRTAGSGNGVLIAFRTPQASALVEAPHDGLRAWLHATTACLPLGAETERTDWDAAFAHVLGTMKP
jgi:hypothetical protein